MRLHWSPGCFASLAVCVALAGCGAKNELNRQAISGEVTLAGQPLKSGSIQFQPEAGSTLSGADIRDGVYSVPVEKGLAPGNYTVRISAVQENAPQETVPGDSSKADNKELIPAEYNSDSQIQVTVEDGGANKFDFKIPEAAR